MAAAARLAASCRASTAPKAAPAAPAAYCAAWRALSARVGAGRSGLPGLTQGANRPRGEPFQEARHRRSRPRFPGASAKAPRSGQPWLLPTALPATRRTPCRRQAGKRTWCKRASAHKAGAAQACGERRPNHVHAGRGQACQHALQAIHLTGVLEGVLQRGKALSRLGVRVCTGRWRRQQAGGDAGPAFWGPAVALESFLMSL
jgi:hypothetical protein